jgi:hypothetical protein
VIPSRPFGPAALQQVARLSTTALFLWVTLSVHNSGALWDAAVRDSSLLAAIESFIVALVYGGSSEGCTDDLAFQVRQRLQPAAAVAIQALCSAIPVASSSSFFGALDATASSMGAPHPHSLVLQLLLSQRPKPAPAAQGANRNPTAASLFFALTELLLRGTVSAICEPAAGAPSTAQFGRPLPLALRRVLADIVRDIVVSEGLFHRLSYTADQRAPCSFFCPICASQASPVIETRVGARETSEVLLRSIRGLAGTATQADALLLANMLVSSGAANGDASAGTANGAAAAVAPPAAPLGMNDDGEVLIGPALPPGQVRRFARRFF